MKYCIASCHKNYSENNEYVYMFSWQTEIKNALLSLFYYYYFIIVIILLWGLAGLTRQRKKPK